MVVSNNKLNVICGKIVLSKNRFESEMIRLERLEHDLKVAESNLLNELAPHIKKVME